MLISKEKLPIVIHGFSPSSRLQSSDAGRSMLCADAMSRRKVRTARWVDNARARLRERCGKEF
jgi:hypothetical protein